LKKATQKLYYAGPWALDNQRPCPKLTKVFLLLFLPEKEALPKP
jgi:hypothetical protein